MNLLPASFWGINIADALHTNDADALAWCRAVKPAVIVIGNSVDLAINCALENPQARVIARFWPDDDIHNVWHDPHAWVTNIAATVPGMANLYVYAGNEPTGDYARHADWSLAAMQKADEISTSENAIKLCIGNFGAGTPNDISIYADCVAYMAQSKHILGVHEYWAFDWVTEGNWPWLIGHYHEWLLMHENLQPTDIVITEAGLEAISQFPGSGSWKTLGYDEQNYSNQLVTLFQKKYFFSGIWGSAIFCGGTSFPAGLARWEPYNVLGANTIRDIIAHYNYGEWREGETMLEIWETWELLRDMNVRESPDGNRITTWEAGTQFQRRLDGVVPTGGYRWYEVEYGETRGWMAYIADRMQKAEVIPPGPPDPPDPDPEPTVTERLDDLEAATAHLLENDEAHAERLTALEAAGGPVAVNELLRKQAEFHRTLEASLQAAANAAGTFAEYCEELLPPAE